MTPDDVIALVFPNASEAGVRFRCALALRLGYRLAVLRPWIMAGQPTERRAAWAAEIGPRLDALDTLLSGQGDP